MHIGNYEPERMEPGHCFTIEVCHFVGELDGDETLTRTYSQLSSRAPTRRSSCILMSGRHQARFVSDDLFLALEERVWVLTVAQSFARSAQAEHMVLITEEGAEVLTRP